MCGGIKRVPRSGSHGKRACVCRFSPSRCAGGSAASDARPPWGPSSRPLSRESSGLSFSGPSSLLLGSSVSRRVSPLWPGLSSGSRRPSGEDGTRHGTGHRAQGSSSGRRDTNSHRDKREPCSQGKAGAPGAHSLGTSTGLREGRTSPSGVIAAGKGFTNSPINMSKITQMIVYTFGKIMKSLSKSQICQLLKCG